MNIIQEAEFDQLCTTTVSNPPDRVILDDPLEVETQLPSQLGKGGSHFMQLRNGLSVLVLDAELSQAFTLDRQHEADFSLTSKFYLSGNSRVLTPGIQGIKDDYEEICGHNYLYCLPEVRELEQWQDQQPTHVVYVCWELDYLRSFSQGWEAAPIALRQLVEGSTPQFYQSIGRITPAMHTALQQLIHCPYRGLTKRLYLEGKSLELLSMQMAQIEATPQPFVSSLTLRLSDCDRLYQAREILIRNLDQPPSLLELARQVGINDHKLKHGFRQVFGTSVFGYFRDHQMQQAKQLLRDDRMNVTEVAHAVGFASVPSFSAAFRKRFGASPKQYRFKGC